MTVCCALHGDFIATGSGEQDNSLGVWLMGPAADGNVVMHRAGREAALFGMGVAKAGGVNALCVSEQRGWLVAATDDGGALLLDFASAAAD